MEEHEVDEWRRKRLGDLVKEVGGMAALGRALGYESGDYVWQMLKGGGSVTERTVRKVEAIYPGWFTGTASGQETVRPFARPAPEGDIGLLIRQLTEVLIPLDTTDRKIAAAILHDLALSPEQGERMAEKLERVVGDKKSGESETGKLRGRAA